ncbi:HNH endonuclease [Kluyvera cryocrescens]|uniref:HNH endonuclease n=1 Tax=Kluyvera cryocrescens TaxID=580 RepID=A0A485CXH9_KLUCR|nr:HNH endonuclease [Kluyvera cryocrescens]
MVKPVKSNSDPRIYGSKWDRGRQSFLRAHPLCVMCQEQGKVAAATVVDHIIPHKLKEALRSGGKDALSKAQKLFWDQKNWQGLCKPHHDSTKQRMEKRGIADLYADVAAGNRPTTDEATWQADPTKRNCYVLNSAPGKMRLPDRNGVQPGSIKAPVMRGDGGTLTAGSVQKGGVPNIAGRIAGWTDRTGAIWSTAQLTPPI